MTEDFPEDRPDDYTLDEFHSPQPETEWQCTICGRVDTDADTIKECCSNFTESYRKYSPEPGDSPRFVYPEILHDSIIEHCEAVRHAIQDQQNNHPLTCAGEEMLSAVPIQNEPGDSEAFSLFCHLVWLQGFGVIPGYPQYTNTTSSLSVTEFCTQVDGVSGAVNASEISDSDLITTDRIYRSKVHSVTDSFWSETQLLSDSQSSPWEWKPFTSAVFPEAGYGDHEALPTTAVSNSNSGAEYEKTAVFGDSTAHNVVVAEACEWAEQIPPVSWTCAPYAILTTMDVLEYSGTASSTPPSEPVWMCDFAAFTDQSQCTVLGFVCDGESAAEIMDQIRWLDSQRASGLLVMDNRRAVHRFLAKASVEGWIDDEIDVNQFKKQPSLWAVNSAIAEESDLFSQVLMMSRKQLIDDTLDPESVMKTDDGGSE